MSSWVQQRSIMTRAELKLEVELLLLKMVPGDNRGPDISMLRKADSILDEIMGLVDTYSVR